MLYDCLIQNAELADTELSSFEKRTDSSLAAQSVSRCIDIMTELTSALRFNFDPLLCDTLSKLYLFFTRQISEAFDQREPGKIRAVLPLIRQLRDAWSQADQRASRLEAAV